jgi:succinate-semialdehyde dehydrogenase/glutarate-semialdehyde dehydrogenase
MYRSQNPYNEIIYQEFDIYSDEKLAEIRENAFLGFLNWKKITLEKRCAYLQLLANEIEGHHSFLSDIICRETGKLLKEARAEVQKSIVSIRQLAQLASEALHPINHPLYDGIYEPIGVILGIMPWNFPLWQVIRYAIPALLAGNTVLLKPAPSCPVLSLELEKITSKVLPKGTFQTILITNEQCSQLIQHPHIASVSFTGSEKAGRIIASQAGQALKPIVLELGSNDALIIGDAVSLQKHFETIVQARLQNNGQSCIAAKRYIIHQSIYRSFLVQLESYLSKLHLDSPTEEIATLACCINKEAAIKLEQQVQKSIIQKATVIYRYPTPAYAPAAFFPPTILEVLNRDNITYLEELFGPIFTVTPFDTPEEAVSLVNSTNYGLGAALFTEDKLLQDYFKKEIHTGTITINDMTKSDARIPFGGVLNSGIGYELGIEGLRSFTHLKIIRNA